MKIYTVALGAVLALILATGTVVAASSLTQGTTCSTPAVFTYKACMDEDAPFTSGDHMLIAAQTTVNTPPTDIPNLASIGYTGSDRWCANDINLGTTWNDCISSIRVWLPGNSRMCLYVNSNYAGLLYAIGPYASWGVHTVDLTQIYSANDRVSSIDFTGPGTGCR